MMLDKQRLRSFLLGSLTGVLAGILLAPKSGKETRGTISDRVGETREKSRERYFDAQENMRERFSASRGGSGPHREAREETASPNVAEPPAESMGERPVLRDVSKDVSEDVSDGGGGAEVSRSEELRRKVRDTRDRLRARADGPIGKGPSGGDEE